MAEKTPAGRPGPEPFPDDGDGFDDWADWPDDEPAAPAGEEPAR